MDMENQQIKRNIDSKRMNSEITGLKIDGQNSQITGSLNYALYIDNWSTVQVTLLQVITLITGAQPFVRLHSHLRISVTVL